MAETLTPLSREERDHLRRLAEEATPGPWALWTGCSWRRFGSAATGETVIEPTVAHDGQPDIYFRNGGQDGPDARYVIAAHPATLLRLLDTVEELERERDALREAQHEVGTRVGRFLDALRTEFRNAGVSRGWSFNWPERSGYAHGELAELVEAVRGKRGEIADEAGDVLLTALLGLVPVSVSMVDCIAAAEQKVRGIRLRTVGVDGRLAAAGASLLPAESVEGEAAHPTEQTADSDA